ncbi:MAG: aminotransferase class IV [bacterium]|nr:aminotransferase class IV [Candidatus Sumerlaeota bacterium]
MKVCLDGNIVDEQDAHVSVFDRGLLFADGLYDTLRTYNGRLFALKDHLGRLAAGCEALQIPITTAESWWRPRIEELIRANSLQDADARLRITVTRGPGTDIKQTQCAQPMIAIFAQPIFQAPIDQRRATGTRAIIFSHRRVPGVRIHQIKTLSLAHTVMAQLECAASGADDAFFINMRDELCEAMTSNIFLLNGNALITPSTDAPCLPGVTRKHLIEAAVSRGMEVQSRPVPVDELFKAAEVFTCASVSEIQPIISVDGHPIGNGTPGPASRDIQQWWRNYAMGLAI